MMIPVENLLEMIKDAGYTPVDYDGCLGVRVDSIIIDGASIIERSEFSLLDL